MDAIVTFLTKQLEHANPLLIPLIPIAMGATKGLVSAIKVFVNRNKTWDEKLKGNIIQTLAAGVALAVAAAQGASVGLFTAGLNPSAVAGWLLLSLIVWLGAIGVHELFTDTNPTIPVQPADMPDATGNSDSLSQGGRP